jgi:hypothetical protein
MDRDQFEIGIAGGSYEETSQEFDGEQYAGRLES